MKNFTSTKRISLLAIIAGLALQPVPSFAQTTGGTGTTVVTGIKWHPGHYILNNLDETQTNELLTKFSDIPTFRGLQRIYYWSDIETSKGVYNFSAIDKDLATVKKYGRKLSIIIHYKYKASPTKSSLPQYVLNLQPAKVGNLLVPAYFVQGKEGDGIYNVGDNANFGHPGTLNAFDNLLKELAKKYDKDSSVAFLQFVETALGANTTPELHKNFIDGTMIMNQKARAAFVSTPLIQSVNFPRARLNDMINNLANNQMGFGGPDTFWGSFSDPKNALAFVSSTVPGVYHYNLKNYDSTKNVNKLPIGMQVHNENMVYTTRELQLQEIKNNLTAPESVQKVYEFAHKTLHSNFLVWQVFGKADPYRIALENKLRTTTLNFNLLKSCPTVYNNTCQQ